MHLLLERTAIIIAFLEFGILDFSLCQEPNEDFIQGKIEFTSTINVTGEPIKTFNGAAGLIYGDYFLEKYIDKTTKILTKADSVVMDSLITLFAENTEAPSTHGRPSREEISNKISDVLYRSESRYMLTNLKTHEVVEFDSVGGSWKERSRYPVTKKKNGVVDFFHDPPELKQHIPDLVFQKDTVIDNYSCKILLDTLTKPNPYGNKQGSVVETKIYISSELRGMPISSSDKLGKQHNGWPFRIDVTIEGIYDGYKARVSMINLMKFTPVLDADQQTLLDRFIKKSKANLTLQSD